MSVSRQLVLAACMVTIGISAAPASAQQMNADIFYQRAIKLKKKGPLAIFQRKEIKALIAEVEGAGKIVKERRLAAEKAGGHGAYCPPKERDRMTSDEYLQRIGAIPQADRKRMTMVEAVTRMLERKYPCRA